MKTSELQGAALDWAVAKCVGWEEQWKLRHVRYPEMYAFTTDWQQGGPIIEREKLFLIPHQGHWSSRPYAGGDFTYGPTPLIAAMRCYVASKMGDEVEIPEELK